MGKYSVSCGLAWLVVLVGRWVKCVGGWVDGLVGVAVVAAAVAVVIEWMLLQQQQQAGSVSPGDQLLAGLLPNEND